MVKEHLTEVIGLAQGEGSRWEGCVALHGKGRQDPDKCLLILHSALKLLAYLAFVSASKPGGLSLHQGRQALRFICSHKMTSSVAAGFWPPVSIDGAHRTLLSYFEFYYYFIKFICRTGSHILKNVFIMENFKYNPSKEDLYSEYPSPSSSFNNDWLLPIGFICFPRLFSPWNIWK